MAKQLAFNLMSYSGLPADFGERYPGGWVEPQLETFSQATAARDINRAIDLLIYADELGFDAIGVNEHHQTSYALMAAPHMIASVLARQTTRAGILILGASIAGYNPPHRIAEEMATLDLMSGGRLIAGFPVGTPFDIAYGMGQNPSIVRSKHREAEEMVLRCWESEEMFAYNGEHHQQRFIRPFLMPLQQPTPPVWVPGGGDVDTWRHAVVTDRNYSYTTYFGYPDAKLNSEGFWEMVGEYGGSRNPFRLTLMQFIGVAESRAEARKLYKEPAEYFFKCNMKVDSRYLAPPGYVSEATLRHKMRKKERQLALANQGRTFNSSLDMDALVDEGYVVVGSPDEVAEEMRHAMIDINAGNLLLLLDFGNMSTDLARYNHEMYAKYVMPQLADLFEDEWENPYWLRPTVDSVRQQTTGKAEAVR